MVVGASRSSRTSGGRADDAYVDHWGYRFPNPPCCEETISGDPERLALFSARGACDDKRVKPDLVAPGTDIISARSSRAKSWDFWGSYHLDPGYAYLGGTSMAAPVVSGCAALVRQYYRSRGHDPSAALIKSTLINGTHWMTGSDANEDRDRAPNVHQGFGRVNMPTTVPNSAEPWLSLEFVDCWKDDALKFRTSNQKHRFVVDVAAGHPLRVCMTYTDLPGRLTQHLLDLVLEQPDGTKLLGNDMHGEHAPEEDHTNNVEVVRIDDPDPGTYMIILTSWTIRVGPQDYALVVTGDLQSGLTQY